MASATVRETFNEAAPRYDSMRRTLIPCFDDFYGTAVDLIADCGPRILDLGAGTGLLAAAIRHRRPDAELVLADVAEDMLAIARERFAGDARVTFRVMDYAMTGGAGPNLGGPFDAVVSALSIHHLEDTAKRGLYARIRRALAPGGRFVNADQVLAPSPAGQDRDHRIWLDRIRTAGASDSDIAAARQRQTHDRLAPLGQQLTWLDEAGFAEIDCVYKWWSFAVFTGTNPETR